MGVLRYSLSCHNLTVSSQFLNHPAIVDYYSRLSAIKTQGFKNESQTQRAFSSLLTTLAEERKWTFVAETPLDGAGKGRKVDGSIRDEFRVTRGHWEAKDEKDDLNAEIKWKQSIGYPTDNIIFEDTRRAVLWQNKREVGQFNLTEREELAELLQRFFEHTDEDRAGFADAVRDFAPRIPDLARALNETIASEYQKNQKYKNAFDGFFTLCQSALNPQIKREAVEELLIQHLLTERIFRTVFRRPEWVQHNPIAGEIERVIAALTSRNFSRDAFLARLDPFYKAIEDTGRTIELWSDKQAFLNTVYERFFQGYSTDTADTMGIVYTPQPIVDWMCASVDKVLSKEWGKSLSTEGVHILDPCTGTGNFLVNVMGRVNSIDLEHKYKHELFANEIMLLPYYIAAGNLEHEYFERMGEYAEFEGLCFTDTLDLFKGAQLAMFSEENSERVAREMEAPITVIIGNPPYNMGQKNENDNNKNRPYPKLDAEIRKTYAKHSNATLQNKLYDHYVRFFKWASERLNGGDGLICFVTNNSLLDQHAFDGMRSELMREFNHIWHLDLHAHLTH
jgi:predicted helicase